MRGLHKLEQQLLAQVERSTMGKGARNKKAVLGDLAAFGRTRVATDIPATHLVYFKGYMVETGVVVA